MLKLEKVSKSMEISISLRDEERFFNRPFLKALALALLIHLAAAMLFQIRPFTILGSQMLFPPAQVDTDISYTSDGGVFANLDHEEVVSFPIGEPKETFPKFPPVPDDMEWMLSSLSLFPIASTQNPFKFLESRWLEPDVISWAKQKIGGNPIQVFPSKQLAERMVINEGIEPFDPRQTYSILFDVQVDDRTGTVCWYEIKKIEGSIDRELNLEAENILRRMRFNSLEHSFITSGEIEIRFIEESVG